jgi:hypothetical protein
MVAEAIVFDKKCFVDESNQSNQCMIGITTHASN